MYHMDSETASKNGMRVLKSKEPSGSSRMLPTGDHTPEGFALRRDSAMERFIKRPIRRFGYPVYIFFVNQWLSRKYRNLGLRPDVWLWGQRGNDYARHRERVNRLLPLKGKQVLIAGCGTGRDVLSWAIYRPELLTGVDYFNYDKAWDMLRHQAQREFSSTKLEFSQGDLTALSQFPDCSIDVVGSDAVFEHARNLPEVLQEFHRVLKTGGIVYATYGPLWYCWGGDHISGFDTNAAGYNHLIMEPAAYERYLDSVGEHTHSEHDGRTWIKHGLFSYLRPEEYLSVLVEAGFESLFVGLIIEPRAVHCLRENPDIGAKLLEINTELDLITTGMTIIYRKV